MGRMEFEIEGVKVRIIRGDITDQTTDAIVNAANSSLRGGGGVDGAIHHRGGPKISEECKRIRATTWPDGLPTGKAVITSGGALKANFVIHTVGPVWHGGRANEPTLLADAYRNSLKIAISVGLKSVSFPSISTGAYGYPIEEASRIALTTVQEILEKDNTLDEVVFVLFSHRDIEIYETTAQELY
jgi:O-acetyl-ADP-ribose deacetylase (regulator of RNase III)